MDIKNNIENARSVIKLVRTRPELYDLKNENYSNRYAHSIAWKELAKQLKIPVIVFKSKWTSLRASYSRSVRHKILYPDKPKPKWYLEKDMSFLKEHLVYNKSRPKLHNFADHKILELNNIIDGDDTVFSSNDNYDNIENNSIKSKFNENDNIENQSKIIERILLEDSRFESMKQIFTNDDDSNLEIPKKSIKTTEKFQQLFNCVTGFLNKQTEIIHEQSTTSADDLFFQSIERDYKKLPDKKKRKFKMISLNSLNELLDETEDDF